MLKEIRSWIVAKEVEILAKSIHEYQELTHALCNGTELCAEERMAIRAGVVAGLEAASVIARGGLNDLDETVNKTYKHAVSIYVRYLKEAEHAED